MKTLVRLGIVLLFALPIAISPTLAFADFDFSPPVDVPDHCTASDIGGTPHSYATAQFLGICALVAAKEQGAISAYQLLYDDAFGFYVQTLNGTVPSDTQYWALYKNGGYSDDGLSTMVVAQDDLLTFQLTDWTDNSTVGSPIEFTIGTLISSPAPSAATGGGGFLAHDPFSIPLAVNYIQNEQHADGSFDSELLNDWIAIMTGGGDAGDIRRRLADFERSNSPALSSPTDYERHAMALEALGIDPYAGTGHDYITPIVAAFDGTQVGNTSLVNDDIFAVFPLLHAGYGGDDAMLQKIGASIVSQQAVDGSWAESVDLTAAGIQALALLPSVPSASDAIKKGIAYLHAQEALDGGFGNSQSTSWALQAVWAVKGTTFDWVKNTYYTPDYYLATKQNVDGGVESKDTDIQTRLWATAYAIPAIEQKTWDQLLGNFPKPAPAPAATATTTTESIATTTAFVEPASLRRTVADSESARSGPSPVQVEPSLSDTPSEENSDASSVNDAATTSAQTAAAANVLGGRSLPLLFMLILAAIFGLIVLWSIVNAYHNRTRS